MKSHFLAVLLICAGSAWMMQCATPTQPTGGPADRTPPQLEETEPASGTTLFDEDRIRFRFSKHVNRDSFREAFRMEPDLNIDYEISFRGRTATVQFNDHLPDTTTMIFTLGTDLSDERNNRISSPVQLALSTGPEIDEGRITARIRDAGTGEGMMGERVVLYRHPVDLSEPADYVGEADSAGTVSFNYLREGKYKAFWLDDRNRNRRWDRDREAAQPFRTDTLELSRADEKDIGSVYVIREDTIPPVLQAVGMLSEVRLRMRFSEEVVFEEGAGIDIYHEDETHVSAIPLYVDRENDNILYAEALEPLPDNSPYRVEMEGISDPSGNYATIGIDDFPGSDEADTTYARYIGNDTRHGIAPDQPLIIRYAKLLYDSPDVLDSLTVVESQTAHSPWPHAEISDNLLFIYPDGEWEQGENYEIRVWDEERLERRTIQPVFHFEDDLGAIDVIVEEPATDTTRHHLQLVDEQGMVIRSKTFGRETVLEGIPEGNYTLTVYEVREDHPKWDPGKVDPYHRPARYFIRKEVPVEPGFTGQVYVEWL